MVPTWIREIIAEASATLDGDFRLPDNHPDVYVPKGVPTYPSVVVCDQCGDECDTACPFCWAGLHTIEHTERHALAQCEGEWNGPDWMLGQYP